MIRLRRAKIDIDLYVEGGEGGEQVCARPPPYTNVCKIWRNFVGFQQIRLLDLAIFLVKGVLSIGFFSLSMSKVENNVQ